LAQLPSTSPTQEEPQRGAPVTNTGRTPKSGVVLMD